MPNTLYERAKEIGESIGMNIDQAGKMKKSTWKREVKIKIKKKYNQDRAYSRPLLSTTITPNLVPWVLKKIFSLEMDKNDIYLGGARPYSRPN